MAGVKQARDGAVGILTLDEPASLNAMTPDLLGALAAAVAETTRDESVRALVLTGAGRLPHKAIIHVAGIGLLWISSERAVRASVRNALELAARHGLRSLAFPLIGAGVGGGAEERVLGWMLDELSRCAYDGEVRIVRYRPLK